MHDSMPGKTAIYPDAGPLGGSDQRMVVESHLVVAGPVALREVGGGARSALTKPVVEVPPLLLVTRPHHCQSALPLPEVISRADFQRHRHFWRQPVEGANLEDAALAGLDVEPNA